MKNADVLDVKRCMLELFGVVSIASVYMELILNSCWQFLLWIVIPSLKGFTMVHTKNLLRLSIILQYLPRLFLIFPLSKQIVKTTGVMTETAWAGAAYNLALYMLASHVLGACWYLLSMERQEACWREACHLESPSCQYRYFDCQSIDNSRSRWYQSSNLTDLCDPNKNFFQFGIYADAVISNVTSSPFLQKYFYCFWWGLKNLSSLGQNLSTSTYVGENSFAIIIAILGLVLFGLLIGNMQVSFHIQILLKNPNGRQFLFHGLATVCSTQGLQNSKDVLAHDL